LELNLFTFVRSIVSKCLFFQCFFRIGIEVWRSIVVLQNSILLIWVQL
jgi:hypothetical protein